MTIGKRFDSATNALTLADEASLFVRIKEMGFDSHPKRLIQYGLRAQKDLTHITDNRHCLPKHPLEWLSGCVMAVDRKDFDPSN